MRDLNNAKGSIYLLNHAEQTHSRIYKMINSQLLRESLNLVSKKILINFTGLKTSKSLNFFKGQMTSLSINFGFFSNFIYSEIGLSINFFFSNFICSEI